MPATKKSKSRVAQKIKSGKVSEASTEEMDNASFSENLLAKNLELNESSVIPQEEAVHEPEIKEESEQPETKEPELPTEVGPEASSLESKVYKLVTREMTSYLGEVTFMGAVMGAFYGGLVSGLLKFILKKLLP